jgi:CRP-like cAMP-binding protein
MYTAIFEFINKYVQFNETELQQLVAVFELKKFKAKERLIKVGEVEKHIYFVGKGLLKKFFYRGREEMITQLADEGSIICSSVSFLTAQPSEYVVQAIEDCEVFSLQVDELEKLYASNNRFERLGRLVIIDWLLQKEIFENERMQLNPKQRFLKFAAENENFMQRVPQKILASYLNMQPETFSRYKHLLVKQPYLKN